MPYKFIDNELVINGGGNNISANLLEDRESFTVTSADSNFLQILSGTSFKKKMSNHS